MLFSSGSHWGLSAAELRCNSADSAYGPESTVQASSRLWCDSTNIDVRRKVTYVYDYNVADNVVHSTCFIIIAMATRT